MFLRELEQVSQLPSSSTIMIRWGSAKEQEEARMFLDVQAGPSRGFSMHPVVLDAVILISSNSPLLHRSTLQLSSCSEEVRELRSERGASSGPGLLGAFELFS
jgi:hypothetical protein